MSRSISALIFLTLCLTFSSPIDATIPSVNFTGLFNQFIQPGTSWCTSCAAFQTQCVMGCAGDTGGGGPCPSTACPSVFTFTQQNNVPIWNIDVATNGSPYRAFSYIPLCTQASQCTEPFIFSFSVRYIPNAGAATPIFNNQQDYLKLLFWGDGNNILGIKQGQLLGLPDGGSADLTGSSTTGTGQSFIAPFPVNVWTNIAVQITYSNSRATLAFYVNGTAIGTTTGSVGTNNNGLQFGTYTWGGTLYTIQYANMAITSANVIPNPNMNGGGVTPVTPAPTQSPTQPTQAPNTTQAPTPTPTPPHSSSLPASSSSNLLVLFLFSCFLLYWQ